MRAFLWPLVSLVIGLAAWSFGAMQATANRRGSLRQAIEPPPLSDLDPRVMRVVTLGHKGLYDDFGMIWLLQNLTRDDLSGEDVAPLTASISSLLRHEPRSESLYVYACLVMSLQLKSPAHCAAISETGLRVFPQSWRIPMTQGYVYMDLLHEPAQASLYFFLASTRKNSPPYVKSLAIKLRDRRAFDDDDREIFWRLMEAVPSGAAMADFFQKNHAGRNVDDRD